GESNIFNAPPALQNFFNTGFLGAIITTILASITWQFAAAAFPIGFLSNPMVYLFLQIALLLEATGICAAAWFLAMIQKKVMGLQYDEVYIGTPEERAAKGHGDQSNTLEMGTNVLASDGAFAGANVVDQMAWVEGTYTDRRERTLMNIKDLREQIKVASSDEEADAFREALKLEITNLNRINKEQETSMSNLNAGGDIEDPSETLSA
ncbi:MAG: hypothetical protein SGARI_001350, partial [Bacillariaceae sp.]